MFLEGLLFFFTFNHSAVLLREGRLFPAGLSLLLGLLELLSKDLLADLLFLNEESTDNTVADALVASGSAVGTRDSLLTLGDVLLVLSREVLHTLDSAVAITALDTLSVLRDVLSDMATTW